ncbi:hypothetical protein, partial [Vibrio parahaemolyticus]
NEPNSKAIIGKIIEEKAMLTLQLAYKPFGVGEWTYTTVSHEVAKFLAREYASYGWPVMIDGSPYSNEEPLAA